MLKELKPSLNLSPFIEGRKQLPADEVEEGEKIASLRIHVESAIGRLKNVGILSEIIPLEFMHMCMFQCNFQPALVSPPESDMKDYIEGLTDSDRLTTPIVKTCLHNQSAPEHIVVVHVYIGCDATKM